MFDYDNTFLVNSGFYQDRVALYFTSELSSAPINSACWTVTVNGTPVTVSSVAADPEIPKFEARTKWDIWNNGIKIFLSGQALQTSDAVSVSFNANAAPDCSVPFVQSELGKGGPLLLSADGSWTTDVIQNPFYGHSVWAVVDVATGNILNCTVNNAWFENNDYSSPNPLLENGDQLNGGGGSYWMSANFTPKQSNSTYYILANLVPARYKNTAQGGAVSSKYWLGGSVDPAFFALAQNWYTNSTALSQFLAGTGSTVTGSSYSDLVIGSDSNTTVNSGAGNDFVESDLRPNGVVGGADRVISGPGNDVVYSGFGADTIDAGTGNDTVFAGPGNDQVLGGDGLDSIDGGIGSDSINGGASSDAIAGGLGADNITGGLAADRINLGTDSDADRVIYGLIGDSGLGAGADQITNFNSSNDRIDLSAIDANTRSSGNQAFLFNSTTPRANAVWYSTITGGLVIRGDVNGNTTADFEIVVKGLSGLTAASFVL